MSDVQSSTEACGTDRGYQRHRSRGTTPCQPCADAHREYERARRQRPKTPARELAPPSGWRDQAACDGADPALFDPADHHTQDDMETLEHGARLFCSWCPVREDCRVEGDYYRHYGTWGGVYRRVKHGEYVWDVFVEGATEPQLTDRRIGVHNGWGVAS